MWLVKQKSSSSLLLLLMVWWVLQTQRFSLKAYSEHSTNRIGFTLNWSQNGCIEGQIISTGSWYQCYSCGVHTHPKPEVWGSTKWLFPCRGLQGRTNKEESGECLQCSDFLSVGGSEFSCTGQKEEWMAVGVVTLVSCWLPGGAGSGVWQTRNSWKGQQRVHRECRAVVWVGHLCWWGAARLALRRCGNGETSPIFGATKWRRAAGKALCCE